MAVRFGDAETNKTKVTTPVTYTPKPYPTTQALPVQPVKYYPTSTYVPPAVIQQRTQNAYTASLQAQAKAYQQSQQFQYQQPKVWAPGLNASQQASADRYNAQGKLQSVMNTERAMLAYAQRYRQAANRAYLTSPQVAAQSRGNQAWAARYEAQRPKRANYGVDTWSLHPDDIDRIDYSTQPWEKWDPNTIMNPDGSRKGKSYGSRGGGGWGGWGGGGGGGGNYERVPEWYMNLGMWRI